MNTARSLLNFNFDASKFIKLYQNIIDDSTKLEINKDQKKIEKIIDKFSPFTPKIPPDVGEIYRLFMKSANEGKSAIERNFSSLRNVKKLVWSLSYKEGAEQSIVDSIFCPEALRVIDDHFKPSMMLAIFSALMKNWISSDTHLLKSFITSKLKKNNGQSKRLSAVKLKVQYYLDPAGIINLCQNIIADNKQPDNVFEYLEAPKSMIGFEYFSEFAETYTKLLTRQTDFLEKIDNIFSFLKDHNLKDTYKKCLEKVVLKVDSISNSDSIRMKILNFCFQHIGDPSSELYWRPWKNANEQDKKNLNKARRILNQWLANKFIYLFFDKIAMDQDRKEFWNRYIDYVTNFKIYMDNTRLYSFKYNNQDIEPAILNCKLGQLKGSGSISSFVLEIKNYNFVEFSHTGGACYIYKSGNELKPDLSREIIRLDRLKHPDNRQMAVGTNGQFYYFHKEGRVFHQGDWQTRFNAWMKRYLYIR
ncbi:MAG: hypothetical protein K8R67_18650 [Desulfobacteraceae bacterium]|nr:hypothetical protein [Desulfobacteraceae bacterium]